MQKVKVFIDGQAGTTGLQLQNRLENHPGVKLLPLCEKDRKDPKVRKERMNEAEVIFLCLPDEAAVEAAEAAKDSSAVIIDAGTAHRVAPGWTYGFPELSPQHRERIMHASRIANPGCHASGFLSIVYPLVKEGILPPDHPFTCWSVTGYTGGGKKMIGMYEAKDRSAGLQSPRQYGLNQTHKHLPEMQQIAGLSAPPVFSPIVADFPRGMAVSVPLHGRELQETIRPEDLLAFYREYYRDSLFLSAEKTPADGFLPADGLAGTNEMKLYVYGNEDRMIITSVFDNLGKGASGAAVQNMNLVLGFPEDTALK